MRQIAVITNYSDDSHNYGSSFEEYRLVLRKPYNKTCPLGSHYNHLTAYLFKAAQDPRPYFIQMVTSRYQFMNLKFLYLSKKHANRTPTFGNSSGIQKRLQKAVQVRP